MMKSDAHRFSTLAARLVRVATPSVLLAAACGTTPPHGGHGGAAGTTGAHDLPPPPPGGAAVDGGAATGYPQCYGGASGQTGPCCLHVRCVEPPDGATECKPANEATARDLGVIPFGSGNCSCGVPGYGTAITGLYSPATAQPYSSTQGPCCYVIPYQSCIGRPLIVEGRDVLAPLAFSSGWV